MVVHIKLKRSVRAEVKEMIRSTFYACVGTIAFTAWLIVSPLAQQQPQVDDDVARLRQQAIALHLARKTEEAIRIYRQALSLAEQRLSADDRIVVQLMEDIAYAYYEPNRRPEAEPFYLRLLAVYDNAAAGYEDGRLWLVIRRLEIFYRSLGRDNDAARFETRARAIETRAAIPFNVVIPAQSAITSDPTRVRLNDCGVITFAVQDPESFLMLLQGTETARLRITTLLNSEFRRILGNMRFDQIRDRSDAVTHEITKSIDDEIRRYGISVSEIRADFRSCVIRDAASVRP
jgi:tetratricopeptide (TPR) repeat protein